MTYINRLSWFDLPYLGCSSVWPWRLGRQCRLLHHVRGICLALPAHLWYPRDLFKTSCTMYHMPQVRVARGDPARVGAALAAGRGLGVQCTCGARFCFECGQEAHEPASCEQVGGTL